MSGLHFQDTARSGYTVTSPAASGIAHGDERGPIVRLDSVSRAFGTVRALDSVTLEVRRGEIFGIIGRSGAGKSTLIRTLNALERIDSGHIVVDGHDLSAADEPALRSLRRGVGMIFQQFNLLSAKTVFENVELPLKLAGVPSTRRAGTVSRLLELVGLGDKSDVYPARLSGGQKQRVGIARALAADPPLLLSDEATSALDPETTLSILRLLQQINRTLGVTVILITHEMSVIREVCDRVAVMEQGRVVEQGPVWQVFAHPQAELTRRLLRTARPGLPKPLQQRLKAQPAPGDLALLRVASAEADRFAHTLSALAADRAWQPQIAHAELDQLGEHPLGTVTFAVRDPGDTALSSLIERLRAHGNEVELLGHVEG